MKTTDDPLDPEKSQKEEATRKKFELLRFGDLKNTRIEPQDWNTWRYFGLFTADSALYDKKARQAMPRLG